MSEPVRVPGRFRRLSTRHDAILIAVLVLFLLVASLSLPRFASAPTVGYLLLGAIPVLLLALPMTLIVITGEIDLSVASVAGMSATIVGAQTLAGSPFPVAVAWALVAGVLAGALNGALIAFAGLPSLAVTIGTLALFRGLALVVIGDKAVASSAFPPAAPAFVNAKIGSTGIPVVFLLVLVLIVGFGVVLHLTPLGRELFAIGYSKEAARFVGVRVRLVKFGLYVASGTVAGLVGLYWALYYSARSDSANGLELTVIAAVLLGGVSIFGGKGSIPGAVAGVLLIASINYALRLQRVPDVVLIIITGSLLILSVIGPQIVARLRRRQQLRRRLTQLEPA